MMVAVVVVVVVVMIIMRNSDRALNTADGRADRTTHDSPDRTRGTIAFVGAFLRPSNDSLGLRCQRHRKNNEHQ